MAEQVRMRAELRRARYGHLLAVHLLLLCAAGHTPSEIAAVLFCSRSSVYRVVKAYRAGTLSFNVPTITQAGRVGMLRPALQGSLLALLGTVPWACGWCRTRWSCATLALELHLRRGVRVSAETVRRRLHGLGWVWKRAKLAAKDNDPQRVVKLARIRYIWEHLPARAALFFADEPTYCPQANPIERAFGDVHDKCTRNHQRKRLWTLVRDVTQHLAVNGPWHYQLSKIYYTPEVTVAVQALAAATTSQRECSQLAA